MKTTTTTTKTQDNHTNSIKNYAIELLFKKNIKYKLYSKIDLLHSNGRQCKRGQIDIKRENTEKKE